MSERPAADRDASPRPELTVAAAASLTEALRAYGPRYRDARVRLSFGGSDALAAQIRQGVRPDVYAAADTALPRRLFREGLVERPVPFATNSLVVAVPASSPVDSLEDLARPGVELAVGSPSSPVGSYTRDLLGRLPRPKRERILANVRTEEPDVNGVVGKLLQGAVDAGITYRTDVAATDGRLRAIRLPARLRTRATYAVAVVRGAERPHTARRFVRSLHSGDGARALRRAGFGPPPRAGLGPPPRAALGTSPRADAGPPPPVPAAGAR